MAVRGQPILGILYRLSGEARLEALVLLKQGGILGQGFCILDQPAVAMQQAPKVAGSAFLRQMFLGHLVGCSYHQLYLRKASTSVMACNR